MNDENKAVQKQYEVDPTKALLREIILKRKKKEKIQRKRRIRNLKNVSKEDKRVKDPIRATITPKIETETPSTIA